MPSATGHSRFVQTGLGALLMLAGIAGVVAMWFSFRHAMETRAWTPVPCLIVLSQLASERPTPNSPFMHHADVRYRYTVEGKTYEGQTIRAGLSASSDLTKVKALVEKYSPGQETTCFVNPAAPSSAILEHRSLAAATVGGCWAAPNALDRRETEMATTATWRRAVACMVKAT